MNIVIPINFVPDLVEELEIDETGTGLDTTWMSLVINEFDDHALEQGILLKESVGGQVIVVAPDVEGADEVLFSAAAKGADRLIKLSGHFEGKINCHALARAFFSAIKELEPGIVLTGVQAHNDIDGQIGPLLAEHLGYPYIGYVAGVSPLNGNAIVRKEFPGGLIVELEANLPAVLGIQAADKPPRYVAFSKVRQAMQTTTIEEKSIPELDLSGGPTISRMYAPEATERATMLEGDLEKVVGNLLELLHELGVS